MSTGASTTNTSTSQQSGPWAPSQPYLEGLMSSAQTDFDNAQGQTAYPNTVASFSPQTQTALNDIWNRASTGSPLVSAADNSVNSLLSPGTSPGNATLTSLLNGYSDPGTAYTLAGGNAQNAALPLISQLASSGVAMPGNSVLSAAASGQMQNAATGIAGQLAASGPTLGGNATLQAGANGALSNVADPLAAYYATQNPYATPASQYLGTQASTASINPYLSSMFSAAAQPVEDAVNAEFGLAGRTGSGADQQELTRNLGDLASNIYGQNYNQAVQNQMSAANSVQSAYDNAMNRNVSATNLLGTLSGQDISNQLGAANNLSNLDLGAYNAQLGAAGTLGNISGQNIANQLGAANNLNSASLGAYNAQLGAAGTLGNLSEDQAGRALSAGSQLSSDAQGQASLIGSAANNLNSQYNAQNNAILTAAGLAPQLAASDYTDLQNLLNVGGAYDTQNQNILNNQFAAWQYAQQQPWNILQAYSGALTGLGALGSTASGNSNQTQLSVGLKIPALS